MEVSERDSPRVGVQATLRQSGSAMSTRDAQSSLQLEPIEANRLQQSLSKLGEVAAAALDAIGVSAAKPSESERAENEEGIDFEQIFKGPEITRSILRSESDMSIHPYELFNFNLMLSMNYLSCIKNKLAHMLRDRVPDPDNPFHRLPNELIFRVMAKLEEKDLGRASRVSMKWRAMAFDPALWRLMSARWDLLTPSDLVPQNSSLTRAFYVSKYAQFQSLQAEALEIQRQEAQRRAHHERHRRRVARVRCAEDVLRVTLFNRVADYLSYFGLLLGTIFIVLKLDDKVTWPWVLVFIPFAFPIFHLLFSLLSYDFVRLFFGPEVHPNLNGTLGEHTGQGHALAHVFSLMRAFRIETYLVVLSIAATGVMIWYKLATRSIALPWWAVLLPVIVAVFSLFVATLFGNMFTRRRGQVGYPPMWRAVHYIDRCCMSYYTVTAILLLIFIALMLVHRVQWTWWQALSPIWVVGIGCVLTPLFYICVAVCGSRISTVVLGDRSTSLICWLGTWIFFLGPFFAFVILIASNLTKWHVRAWAAVFAPIFVLEAILFCVCISYDVVILLDD